MYNVIRFVGCKVAVCSKGTQTSIDEALLSELDIKPEQRDDWQEVQNYIEALNYSLDRLDKLPAITCYLLLFVL
ncbi:MAG: hypothetical protein COA58_16825 [Bacteroidetes bacterium]|nr:MAG: hypothetical protein COA58_16825 [Bacteroidota bacterium]